MRLSSLQNKDVVSLIDGKKIGKIIDVIIQEDGTIKAIIVEKSKFLMSMFTSNNEIEIRWKSIEKIGEDVILVNVVFS